MNQVPISSPSGTHNSQWLFHHIVGAHLCVRPPEGNDLISKWLREMTNKYPGVGIDCYAIMPDHILMVLAISGAHTGAPLPEIVKWFKTQTTNDYIRGVKAGQYPPFDKHIWQRGYFDHGVRCEQDLTETRRYILNNPLKLTLSKE